MDTPTTNCSCNCHTNVYATCDTPGGCGTTGCRPAGSCPTCRRRDPEYGLVCEPCRRWLPVAIASIPRLAADAHTELIPADDSTTIRILVCETCGLDTPWTADRRYARHPNPDHDDPTSDHAHGGWVDRYRITHTGGPAPSLAPDIIITGGDGEPPVPLNLHLHDLLADVVRDGGIPVDTTRDTLVPADTLTPVKVNAAWFEVTERREETVNPDGTITVTLHRDFQHVHKQLDLAQRQPLVDEHGNPQLRPAGDQTGTIPIAQVLDQEVRAWIDAGAPGNRWRPTPTIDNLCQWLTARLDWAFDHYPAMDATAAAIGHVRGQLMAALGEFDPEPERCEGVECGRCDLRMLYRRQDGTGDVECQNPNCRKVYTADSYREWVQHLGAFERAERSPAEVAELLRAR